MSMPPVGPWLVSHEVIDKRGVRINRALCELSDAVHVRGSFLEEPVPVNADALAILHIVQDFHYNAISFAHL